MKSKMKTAMKTKMSNIKTGDETHVGFGVELTTAFGDAEYGYFELLREVIPNAKEIFENSNFIYKEMADGYPEVSRDKLAIQTREMLEDYYITTIGFLPKATLGFKLNLKK